MKNLEQFIEENLEKLNQDEPGDLLNEKIKKRIYHIDRRKKYIKLFSGVAIFITVGLSMMIYVQHQQKGETEGIVSEHSLVYDYKNEINYLNALITHKKDSIVTNSSYSVEICKQFLDDYKVLESDYQKLKQELEVTPNRNFILSAMKNNLLWQIELLDRQNHVLNLLVLNN